MHLPDGIIRPKLPSSLSSDEYKYIFMRHTIKQTAVAFRLDYGFNHIASCKYVKTASKWHINKQNQSTEATRPTHPKTHSVCG